ncbi:hypothetical protein BC830DRAFT_54838 [Chytriomyces sp. MP71]|nr:hypothetical protein BC830DRAFT_54838 [Chytriomyces sp. MP71]
MVDRDLYLFLHTLHKQLFESVEGVEGQSEVAQGGNVPPLVHSLQPIPRHLRTQLDALLDAKASLSGANDVFVSAMSAASSTSTSSSTTQPNYANPSEPLAQEYLPSRRGAPCGHVFADGEGVFWCRNCALDDTCVMCYNCFHASNHDGHDTTFHVSSGGGCCDCGDSQAWRMPVHCAFHSLEAPATDLNATDPTNLPSTEIPVSESVLAPIRSTVATVLDFIIDTFNMSPTDFTLPTRMETVLTANPPEPGDEDCGSLTVESGADPNVAAFKRDMFVCVLWNDETHTFDEVIFKVSNGVNCSQERAAQVAVNVDAVGRDTIASSYQLSRLLAIARSINENRASGLSVSIRTVRDTFRENLAGHLVAWLRDLPSRVRGPVPALDGRSVFTGLHADVRRIVCEELCSPRRKVRERVVQEFATAMRMEDVLRGEWDVSPRRVDDDGDVSMAGGEDGEKNRWRIDYLISFDSRLWKELRATLKGLYIETLIVAGEEYKKAMATRFAYTYPLSATSYLIQDREFDLSMMTFTVQLFTVPTIAEYLLTNTSVVHCLFAIVKGFLLSDVYPTVFPYGELLTAIKRANKLIRPAYTKLTCESTEDRVYKGQKYGHIFNDIRYFFASPPIRLHHLRTNLSEFSGFLDLCRVMQGMYPQKRHIRTHVEYESAAWTYSFYLSANISRVLEHIGDAFAPTCKRTLYADLAQLIKAIKLTLKVLDDWCAQEQVLEFAEWDRAVNERSVAAQRSGTPFTPPIRSLDGFIPISYCQIPPSQRVLDFKALGRSLSLHFPLHWVLGKLVACLAQYGAELGEPAFHLKDVLTVEELQGGEPRMKDLSDLSFVQDLDDWGAAGRASLAADNDAVTLPPASPVPPLLQQISAEDHIVRILDHPLRTEVFLSQIRTGLWVRNGMSMRSQQMYFKYILLRDLYDLDIFLIQTFAAVVSSDRFIATLLDRYDIRAWFEANVTESAKKFFGEPQPSIGLAEDLLNLLINVLTERGRAMGGMNVEALARREIIHALATSPNGGLPYSKISESVPYEITRLLQGLPMPAPASGTGEDFYFTPCKSIDTILAEVANFKPPTLATDKGVYELKDECYDEVDPWFHHYTRTQREEVEATLLKRLVKKSSRNTPVKMSEAARNGSILAHEAGVPWVEATRLVQQHGLSGIPHLSLIPVETGFAALDCLCAGKSFALLLLMGLHNLTRTDSQACKSDHAMASIVQLLMIAIEIDVLRASRGNVKVGERFVDQAGVLHLFESVSPQRVSLIGKVLEVLDRGSEDAFKDNVEKLSWFVVRVSAFGTTCSAGEQISAWQQKHRAAKATSGDAASSAGGSPADLERERRKAEAKQRQAAIMAKFAQQQKSFLDENMGNDSDLEDDDEDMEADKSAAESAYLQETRSWSFPGGNCIMCQEEFKDDKLYGMLCLVQPCYMQRSRFVDLRDPQSVLSALNAANPESEAAQPSVFTAEASASALYQRFPRSVELFTADEPRDTELYTSSCGHLMHSSCFEQYFTSIEGRQSLEHRLYAENVERGEFLCPLCKSLGNVMLPIKNETKTETVNWSGSTSGSDPGAGMVPLGKGGVKNAFSGLQEWWDMLKPRLAESLSSRTKMQTDEQVGTKPSASMPAPEAAAPSSSSASRTTSGQQRLPRTLMGLVNDRRGSDGSVSSAADSSARGEQSEIQDLIDRLITPLIRMTDDCLTNGLLNSLEYTITSLERSLRGTVQKDTPEIDSRSLVRIHILELLSGNTLTFLRVLSQSILHLNKFQNSSEDFDKSSYPDAMTDLQILFAGMDESLFPKTSNFTPQLEFNGFASLVGITFMNDDPRILDDSEDIYKWISLCWASEVVRTIVALIQSIVVHGDAWYKNDAVIKAAVNAAFNRKPANSKGKAPANASSDMMEGVEFELSPIDQEHAAHMSQFLIFIVSHLNLGDSASKAVLEALPISIVFAMVRTITLPYLRACTLYLYARFFIVPPTGNAGFGHALYAVGPVREEYEQLSAYLQLPSLWELCSTATIADPFLSKLIRNWVEAMQTREETKSKLYSSQIAKAKVAPYGTSDDVDTYRLERSITLEFPGIISLIGLPNGLENLFADCFRKNCGNCQKQIQEPALCLVCGTLVCALTFCCHRDRKGECNNHMKLCSGEVGIFFLVKKFKILMLHNEKGCMIDPPYLDVHGEVDSSRRKGSRQFLHLKRYDDIRKMWLSHNLPSYIARTVEANHFYGGWSQY